MDMEDVEAKLREIELNLLAHKALLTIALAAVTISSDNTRRALEDMLAQAVEAREIHIPPAAGETLADLYPILRGLLEQVNRQLSVPLRPRFLPT
ncbi:MAG: hypothetical protein U1A24_08635 [Cypionkella sp.]|uniref:hypothetical protein n=1 Tax=Cypionkella sp. TaxID=2811411 RepID=UPI002ABB7438|nr:hypothetical protein [Cypionkella sp.]MDZ4310610.1 hypothetical protein [Cypionkella sp.]